MYKLQHSYLSFLVMNVGHDVSFVFVCRCQLFAFGHKDAFAAVYMLPEVDLASYLPAL